MAKHGILHRVIREVIHELVIIYGERRAEKAKGKLPKWVVWKRVQRMGTHNGIWLMAFFAVSESDGLQLASKLKGVTCVTRSHERPNE